MKKMVPLNDIQRKMVEENLKVVKQAIRTAVVVNENIYGFEYDDLYQEGCIMLCKAAVNYDPQKNVLFSTYAQAVVANGLKTYCRLLCNKQKHMIITPFYNTDENMLFWNRFSADDTIDSVISEIDTSRLLYPLKQQYTGVVLKGIKAIELKTKGYTGAEIAKMFGVKPNLVGAWISKAVKKLEKNEIFIMWRDNLTYEKLSS